MEGTHGQLGTGLTDGLCSDDTNRFTHIDQVAVCQVCTVALCAYTLLCLAAQHGTDLDGLHAGFHNTLCIGGIHQLVLGNDQLALVVPQILYQVSAHQTLCQRLNHFVSVADLINLNTVISVAVMLPDDHILGNVYQTTGQITGVRSTQCGIRQTLPGASGGNEVFQNVQAFPVVGSDRHLDGSTGGVGDQTTHAC